MSIYVISEDIQILLQRWAQEKGFTLPPPEFFAKLRQGSYYDYLERIFGKRRVDLVPEGTLSEGMEALIEDAGLTPLSIDPAYFPAKNSLSVNRKVTADLADAPWSARYGHAPLTAQVKALYQQGLREVVLVDDVIFTGHCMGMVIDLLQNQGIRVPRAVAGVVVGDGRHALRSRGVEVRWVRFYSEVVDEICERDFYPGVPYCGRALAEGNRDRGAPYLLPFGNPMQWASIPEAHALIFSKFCLWNAVELWKEIEKASGRPVQCRDVPRLPPGAPDDSTHFVEYLETCLEEHIYPREERNIAVEWGH